MLGLLLLESFGSLLQVLDENSRSEVTFGVLLPVFLFIRVLSSLEDSWLLLGSFIEVRV
jgi:hypothetical protein